MRKLIVSVSAAAIAAGALAACQAGASAGSTSPPEPHGAVAQTAAAATGLSFTTTMISYTPVKASSAALAPGDGYLIAGKVTRDGASDGLSTAQCTFTHTAGPVLRVCTVDYALNTGLIATSGYIDGPGKDATVTLAVDGGTGAYAGARGYGTLQPTAAGSDVTLHLTG